MNDDRISKLQDAVMTIGKQLLIVDGALAEIRASVNVLKLCVATQTQPDDVRGALEYLATLEKSLLDGDPSGKERQEALDIGESLHQWVKRGRPPMDS